MLVNNNKKGQAVIEFLVFFPFMLILYFSLVTIGNSINASINQQKIARSYLYNIIHNNSYVYSTKLLNVMYSDGIIRTGMFAIGWAEQMDGETPVASCFRLMSLAPESQLNNETCISKIENKRSSRFIRPKTVYGICSESFFSNNQNGGAWTPANNIPGNRIFSAHYSSCLNTRN